MARDINIKKKRRSIKKERRRGMRNMLLIILICGFFACDVKISDRTVYRSPMGQLADYLRQRREKEGVSHPSNGILG